MSPHDYLEAQLPESPDIADKLDTMEWTNRGAG